MEIFESLVERFLTYDGKVFVAPQYAIPWDPSAKIGGSCPDFVLLDESRSPREVVVVEVTTGEDLKSLFERIEQRETRWYVPLRNLLRSDVRLLVFVRKSRLAGARKWAQARQIHSGDVCFHALEEAVFAWDYDEDRLANGLPR